MKNKKIAKYGVVILTIYAIGLTYYTFWWNGDSTKSTSVSGDETKKIQELEQRIVQYGDTNAYMILIENYGSAENLIYSIFMADQYGYPRACHYVYDDIAGILYGYNGIVPDSIVRNLILACLYRGEGDKDCSMELGMLYTTGYMVYKDTLKGRYFTEMAFREEGEEYINRIMKMYQTNKIFDLPHTK